MLTFIQQLEQESILTDQQSVFNTAIKQTTVRIDGDQLRLTGQTKNQNNQTEEIVVTYRFSDQEEKERWQTKEIPEMLKITGGLERPNTARNFNQFDYRTYLKRKQIHWTLKAEKIELAVSDESLYSLAYQTDRVRSDFFNFIDQHIQGKSASYLKALLFADKRALSNSTLENYRALGIVHLLSISGLHISFLIMFVEKVLLRLRVTKEKTALILFCLLPVYGLMAGFGISVFRAVIQAMLRLGSRLLKRNIASLDIWSYTMLLALLVDPYQIYSAGFQLSYLLSGILVLLSGQTWFIKQPAIKSVILLNGLISLVSLPILTYHFYEFSWVVLLLNLVFVPLFSYLVLPLLIGLLISIPVLIFLPWLKEFVLLADLCINYLEKLVEAISSSASFNIITGRLSIIGMSIMLIGITWMFINFERSIRRCNHWQWWAAGSLIVLGLFSEVYSPAGKVVMLNIGQGDALLIKEPFGRGNYLIDTGGAVDWKNKEEWAKAESPYSIGKNTVVPSLKSLGVPNLDQLILTHADTDHVGALKDILEDMPTTEIIATKRTLLDPIIQESYPLIKKQSINLKAVNEAKQERVGPDLMVLYPLTETNITDEISKNDASLVLYGKIGGQKWLFTGDVESGGENELLSYYPGLKADILKVAHHGSKTSSQETFVNKVSPAVALISSGQNNFYGHPHAEVVKRLKAVQAKLYRTDQQGAVMFTYLQLPMQKKSKTAFKTAIPADMN